jgi:2',3'-cyclic-nucleotide 2'-phosphodiesterase (5'-nucleotidase family)
MDMQIFSFNIYNKTNCIFMSQFNNVVFGKKKFSDILEEIYENQQKKDKQVTALINELKPLISDIGDATLVVPLIKEYMEISVKNDDLLIKMAALAQRAMQTQTADGSLTISDEEKEQLLAAMNDLKGDK